MSTKAVMDQKPEVGREHFLRLLARLSPDREQAWQEYASLKQKLVTFFEPHLEAEDLAEAVFDRIAKKEDSYGITNVVEFAFGVARNLRKETYRRDLAKIPASDGGDFPVDGSGPENTLIETIDGEKQRKCFFVCMQHLTSEERHLIFEYFPNDEEQPDERRQKLAQKLNLTAGALRTRMTRLREKLESCCGRCIAGKYQNGTGQGWDQ
jgi:DNA-directed RNA polymerase specialized sigma24 family protein